MSMTIRKYGSTVLREKAVEINKFDAGLIRIVEEMKEAMKQAAGVGLAAPQVGIAKRLFLATLDEKLYVMINPKISPLSTDTEIREEGCLSIPGVWVDVERYVKIKLNAQDINGESVEMELEGFPARVIQHELDHLNGVLIIDRITPAERRKLAEQLEEIKKTVS